MWKILVVEDCPDSQRLVGRALSHCEVRFADRIASAQSHLEREVPDLIVLDLALPDGSAFGLCSTLQNDDRTRDVPIVFLTASHETRNKVTAFSLGAEDYLEKPFEPVELRARVEARLRKARERAERGEALRVGNLWLDVARLRAWVIESGARREIELTPHEFQLLHHLARQEGRVARRPDILHAVWGDVIVTQRTIDTHVSNLRRKLGPEGPRIEAVRGIGYRLRAVSAPPADGSAFLT